MTEVCGLHSKAVHICFFHSTGPHCVSDHNMTSRLVNVSVCTKSPLYQRGSTTGNGALMTHLTNVALRFSRYELFPVSSMLQWSGKLAFKNINDILTYESLDLFVRLTLRRNEQLVWT